VKLVSFGEVLLRLAAPPGQRLSECDRLDLFMGGSELNVAANLVTLGFETRWVSLLPEDPEGDLLWQRLRGLGVDLRFVGRAPGRLGYYWHEPGSPPRPDYVPVRRASLLNDQLGPLPWAEILQGYEVFHCSGITPGLGPNCVRELRAALEECGKQGLRVSYDLNYRSNLWSLPQARETQLAFLHQVDTLFVAPADLEVFFDGAEPAALLERFGLRQLVLSRRRQGAYQVVLHSPEGIQQSDWIAYEILDRIGVGDAMVAGFWAGGVETAALCAALKYTLRGDQARLRPEELQRARRGGEILR
jgi:2-dehydro-3-deoxygluconokinase